MKAGKKRKEVVLDKETLDILELKAEKAGRNLKNYMEFVLQQDAFAFEPSEEYKKMMDQMIDSHNQGKTKYTPWLNVKKELFK
ncbi:hypothetical protein [Lacinutrix sp. Hel_I_90]|uniref:hypothetical protein n=1 Tax=Lacinutrix sp. Hel_I_90 TaxID=1249999 RepID=UPI0005C7F100|nr:hypothetical protein [Lacinutrix sp. Hel_I_90]